MEQTKESLVQRLWFSKIDERLTHLTSAQGTTCRWFIDEPKYKSWQDASQQPVHGGFLWIKGNPGTGKSTLMKFLFERAKLNAKDDPSRLTLSFFFLARGTVEEKTTTGLYRSLLHQLFTTATDLQDSLDWLTADGARIIQRNGWSDEALQQTLKHAIPKLGERSLTMFVDALDECDQNKAGDMVSFFEELCDCAAEARVLVQICFSSRHYPTVVVDKGIELTLEAETGHVEDIQKYVKSRLKLKSKHAELLRSEILQKSSGIFLWVVLVLDILNNEKSISIQKLRDRLKEIPPKLNDLFQMILTRDGDDLKQLQLCLKWILFASRALQPDELYFAIQICLDKECSGFWDQEDLDMDSLHTFVRNCSKGLAEVTRNKASEVQFIHESVRDFLLGKYAGQWSGASENLRSHAHNVLRDCCLVQLNAEISKSAYIPDSLTPASEAHKLRESLSLKFPFLRYSVHNVLNHSNLAQRNGSGQEQFIADFPLERWILLNDALEKHDIRRYTTSARLLYILAEKNLPELVRIHPDRWSCLQVGNERYRAPILAALAHNNREAVGALLRALADNEPPTSPLHGLSEQYEQDDKRAKRFSREFKFNTKRILHDLLSQSEEVLAQAFLLGSHNFPVSVASTDARGQTPLCYAAISGCQATSRLLLQRGALVNSQGRFGRTALSWAALGGKRALVKMLLESNASVYISDEDGRMPLSLAAKNGHRAVVELLIEQNTEIDSKDSWGQTPLSLAAGNGHRAVVELLLESNATFDLRDRHGRTPLSHAAENGHRAVVELLFENNATFDSKDWYGRTPLSYAAENGHHAVVELLIAKDAKVETMDASGLTPRLRAHMGSHDAVANLLTQHSRRQEMEETERRLRVEQMQDTAISFEFEWISANKERSSQMDRNEI